MTIDPAKKAKLDPMAQSFIKFCEEVLNVKWVDTRVEEEVEEEPELVDNGDYR